MTSTADMDTQASKNTPEVLGNSPAQANTAMEKKCAALADDTAIELSSPKRPHLEQHKDPDLAIATTDEKSPASNKDTKDNYGDTCDPNKGACLADLEGPLEDVRTRTDDEPCRLLDLPQELLLKIMATLDRESLYVFRQTSRAAFWMAYDESLKKHFEHRESGLIWGARQYFDHHDEFDEDAVAKLIQVDRLCGPCRRVRDLVPAQAVIDDLVEGLLYCSGCQKKHSRVLFATEQRAKPAWERICISLQGRVWLCPHVSLGWEDIARERETHRLSNKDIAQCLECDPEVVSQSGTMGIRRNGSCFSNFVETRTRVRLFRYSPHDTIDLDTLKKLWRAFPRKEVLKGIVCPHIDVEGDQLLACFGEQTCACLGLPLNHDAGPRFLPCAFCCICSKRKGDGEPGKLLDVPDGESFYDRQVRDMHQYRCAACTMLTSVSWVRDGDWIVLECKRDVYTGDPHDLRWIVAMDPLSWDVPEDREAKHFAWCPDASCAVGEPWGFLTRLLQRAERRRHAREGELWEWCDPESSDDDSSQSRTHFGPSEFSDDENEESDAASV